MDAHPCTKKAGAWTRAAAALALTLGALTLSAGTAAAGPATEPAATTQHTPGPSSGHPTGPVAGLPTPSEAVAALCAEWEAFAATLPYTVAPPPVCKLVNGWD
ncbi:hypothetical protein ACIPPS_09205 [Streptomyces sp. NPDC090127]|uniref:hypothetical protein n=1 Tax=Streptomyces sp. NPDC090127 TaxID=3365953 RepID=UPI00380764AD